MSASDEPRGFHNGGQMSAYGNEKTREQIEAERARAEREYAVRDAPGDLQLPACSRCGSYRHEVLDCPAPSDEPRAKEGPPTTMIALEDIPPERIPVDEPREEYVPSQSCEDDYLAIDGHIYPNRPLAKIVAAVLAEVARLEADPEGCIGPAHLYPEPYTPYSAAIHKAAHGVITALWIDQDGA